METDIWTMIEHAMSRHVISSQVVLSSETNEQADKISSKNARQTDKQGNKDVKNGRTDGRTDKDKSEQQTLNAMNEKRNKTEMK